MGFRNHTASIIYPNHSSITLVIEMKRYLALCLLISASTLLSGCYKAGTSAPAPTNVQVAAGDTSATLTWDMTPGVEYWIFKAATTSLTPQDCLSLTECGITMKAVSPTVVAGLVNGTVYSFTINGRIDGGKGGAGSPSAQATPRLAGATWSLSGTPLGTNLNGVGFGSVFVAAGDSGVMYSSTDGISWTLLSSLVTTKLNAVSYYGGNYLVAGAGGVILRSLDATVTWPQQTSGTTNDLYAISNYGSAGFVATGASGTIIHSGDGITWTSAKTSNPASNLYSVTYGNNMYVAVGAAGALLSSTDGVTWNPLTPTTPISLITLRSIAYAPPATGTIGTGTFVAVGSGGTIVTSADGGTTWTPISSTPFTATINAITYGRQFVAVAEDGSVNTSIDGINWAATTTMPANSSPIYAVTRGLYDYTAVGAGGLNLHSK